MKDQTLINISKIIAVFLGIFGALTMLSAVTILIAGGSAGMAESMLNEFGEQIESLPYSLMAIGGTISLLLGIVYFVASYGLFTQKKWTYVTLYLLATVGVFSGLYGFFNGISIALVEILFAGVYASYGYLISVKKDVFCK